MPAVTVIIPNYNHAPYLSVRIESVLKQSFADFELIILDDCSTDNSKEIIMNFADTDRRISFYPSDQNSGSPFIQWNKGVKLAKADLVWIAESDDAASPYFLQQMVDRHKLHPKIGIAYCQSNRMNDESKITGSWKTFTNDLNSRLFESDFVMNGIDFIDNFLIHKNVIPNASGAVFKKKVYDEVGGVNEKLRSNSDWLTWLKILLKYDVAFISEALNDFRFHNNSVIARLHTGESKDYKEQYDLTMRNEFEKYYKTSAVFLPASIIKQNKKYQSFDFGNKGLYQLAKGQSFEGLINLIRASTSPKLTLGYFRRLIKGAKYH